MKMDIIGKTYTLDFIVDPTMTARLDSIEIHKVCSTVTMTYFAELASRKAIEPYFESSENAVGGGINLKHKGMAAIGEHVSMTATITAFDGKILICDIEARIFGSEIVLCKGSQTQIVLNNEIIEQLIETVYLRNVSQ